MKKLKFLALAAVSVFISNCNDDDDATTQNDGLQGEWRLVSRTYPMVNETHTYEDVIKWNFNESTQVVTVTSTSDDIENPLQEGVYDYTVAPEPDAEVCDEFLTVEDFEAGCIEHSNNQLRLTQAYLDGPIYTFVR